MGGGRKFCRTKERFVDISNLFEKLFGVKRRSLKVGKRDQHRRSQ